ncbi:MAG: CUAEP/CCAEP-tail radical SAM (seleno)protein [Nitrospiria bacterium]
MKCFGDILLVSCYELGHQPLGVAWPFAFLKRAGYRPDAMDLSVEALNVDKVKKAKLIGISVPMHTALRIGKSLASRIREINPGCHISFYGLYASLNGKMLLKQSADSVIGGEYEAPLLSLVISLDTNGSISIPGVRTQTHRSEPLLAHLSFPIPDRNRLPPLTRYARLLEGRHERPVGYVEASRGCRHLCRHCPIPPVYGGRFFILPQDIVMSDIRNLVDMGARHITFGDPDFLNGPVHSLRIARALHQAYPTVTFDFTAKVEHLIRNRNLLPEMASLGCLFVVSAVESMNENVLKHLAKQHTRDDVIRVLRLVSAAGMAFRPSLVPFTPWTTLDDLLDLFETVESEGMIHHVDPVQYTIRLLIPPGSLLLSDRTVISCLGHLDPGAITYRWKHPDPRIDPLQEAFSGVVEQHIERGIDAETTFYQLKEHAFAVHDGRRPIDIHIPYQRIEKPVPRLSEPWFCCAEPTDHQMRSLDATDCDHP